MTPPHKAVRIYYPKEPLTPELEMEEIRLLIDVEECGLVTLEINHPAWCPEPPLRMTPDNAIELATLLLEQARIGYASRTARSLELLELQREFELLQAEYGR